MWETCPRSRQDLPKNQRKRSGAKKNSQWGWKAGKKGFGYLQSSGFVTLSALIQIL